MHDKLGKSKVLYIYTGRFKYSHIYMLVHLAKVVYTNLFGKLNYWSHNTDSPPPQCYVQQLVSKQVLQKKLGRLKGDPSS